MYLQMFQLANNLVDDTHIFGAEQSKFEIPYFKFQQHALVGLDQMDRIYVCYLLTLTLMN